VVHTKLGKPQKVLIFLLVWHPKFSPPQLYPH
jgi:hypothetical protein